MNEQTQPEQSYSREATEEEVRHMGELLAYLGPEFRAATRAKVERGGYIQPDCAICSAIRKACSS